jgi:hypothetical protein
VLWLLLKGNGSILERTPLSTAVAQLDQNGIEFCGRALRTLG